MSLTILIVDDHPVILIGVRAALEKDGYAQVVECDDYRRIGLLIQKHEPDVILLDLFMPKFQIERDFLLLRRKYPKDIFIAYTGDENADLVERCRALGFHGYILKSRGFLAIRQDIEAIINGARLFPQIDAPIKDASTGNELSEIQMNILRLMASGCKNSEIAECLAMREATIDYHKRNIKNILGANTSAEVVARAQTKGWI